MGKRVRRYMIEENNAIRKNPCETKTRRKFSSLRLDVFCPGGVTLAVIDEFTRSCVLVRVTTASTVVVGAIVVDSIEIPVVVVLCDTGDVVSDELIGDVFGGSVAPVVIESFFVVVRAVEVLVVGKLVVVGTSIPCMVALIQS